MIKRFLKPALWMLVAGISFFPSLAAERAGLHIYKELCASCHGPNGEGVADKHDEPLYGDRSLKSLTRLIERTMPEDAPEKCVGEDAAKVAAYIYDAFYSPQARSRTNPPKIDLARLTVRQYLNSVADLMASFAGSGKIDERRGLEAQYYDARNTRGDRKVFERVDPQIDFSFGTGSPDPIRIAPEEFSMRWRGSLIAEETGDYEFMLKTENGARLSLNDDSKPLIDAWVSSGGEVREHRETIRLLGGRAYPIEVDYFKFKDKTASLVLQWKPPHKTWETIPQRNLSPARVPETFVVTTAFPPDDGSAGYERGTTVSKAWDQAATYAAIEVADKIVERLEKLSGAKADADDREERVKEFCGKFAERAFRRPLTDEQKRLFVQVQFEGAKDLKAAAKRSVLLVLKSPRFLYPELNEKPDDYDIASRLSYGMWDSLPDEALLAAAAKGNLRMPEQITEQAQRMLQDPRAKSKLADFFHHWLEMEEAEDLSKDPAAFPDFTDSVLSDLRTSLELFIEDVVWSDKSDYRELLLADYLYLNPRLAKFYQAQPKITAAITSSAEGEPQRAGAPETSSADEAEFIGPPVPPPPKPIAADPQQQFTKVPFDSDQRVGVLTHPYLLTAFAYYKSSSPIHRGVFLTRNIVGRSLKPPPMAIQFMDGRFDPSLTMREKVAELTRPAACQGCHSVINPLGFSLEHFDGVGRYRTTENNKPIDATGEYTTNDGETIPIKGARDIAQYAANSEEAQRGFIRQLFQHTVKQPAPAYGPDTFEKLGKSFAASDFHIQKLLVEIVKLSALHGAGPEKIIAAK